MDFFDKVRVTLSSPLKGHYTDTRDFKTWFLPTHCITLNNVRLLLYRDCEHRGRKCLFDSAHVIKDIKTGKFTYIPVTNTGQVKDLCEWVFGCVPLGSASTKRFHRLKGNLIWSRTFKVPVIVGNYTSASRNISGRTSCLSSNGELTSSGYTSSSGMESSYDQLSTDSYDSWPFQKVSSETSFEETESGDIKLCHSLPSRLNGTSSKITLGIAIVVATGDEDSLENRSLHQGEWKQLGSYIASISRELELSTDWFSSIAVQSYLNPSTFVETLYNFSEQYRHLLVGRLTNPLANIKILPLSVKNLPVSIGEFLTVYMINDLWWIKCLPAPKRCKIVIVANPRKLQEVKSVLSWLKLINQCACGQFVGATLRTSSLDSLNSVILPDLPQLPPLSHLPHKSPLASGPVINRATEEWSVKEEELGTDVLSMNPEDFLRRSQDSQLLKQVPTKDSGISSALSSRTSLKRCATSEKSLGQVSRSDSEDYLGMEKDKVDKRVSFHLGEEPDTEQTFDSLGLSEPNPDKLKSGRPQALPTPTCPLTSVPPGPPRFPSEGTSLNTDSYTPDKCSFSVPRPSHPVQVDLNFSTTTLKAVKFCSYCDSISIVDRFNPLFQIQWLKCTHSSTNHSSFEQCTSSSVDTPFSSSPKFSLDNWIFYNLDKSIINYFNATSKQEYILTEPPSALVTNLLEHVQVLMDNSRESEIEQFVNIQLRFIRKLGEDFGKRLLKLTKFDIGSMPYVRESDLGLLFAIAGYRFPELREKFFV